MSLSEGKIGPSVPPKNETGDRLSWKMVVLGSGLILFLLLNIWLLFNAASLVPDERTQRLILFGLNPEYWPNWYAQALWMFAAGLSLSTILKTSFVQGRLEALARTPFFSEVSGPKPRFTWLETIKKYPAERFLLSCIERLYRAVRFVLRPKYYSLLVLSITILATGLFVFAHLASISLQSFFSFATLHGLAVWILRVPYLLYNAFIVVPIAQFLIQGVFSWRVPLAFIVPFLLIMGLYLYGRKIKKYLLREDVKPLAIRYFLIVTTVYAAFLPSLSRSFRMLYLNLNGMGPFNFYNYFIWEPLYLFLNQGVLSWRLCLYVVGIIVIAALPYLGFRRFYYSSNRFEKFKQGVRTLAIPLILLVCYFWHSILFVVNAAMTGLWLMYRKILYIPTYVWECVYFAPCYFLYCSEVSWKLLVGPILFATFCAGYFLKPFRKIGNQVGFSPNIFYCLFWTILLSCCFYVTIWKILLGIAVLLLAYHVAVREFRMPKIRFVLSPAWKRICFCTLVVVLILLDLFLISFDSYLIYRYYKKFILTFFYLPLVDLFCGQPTWSLLGPITVLLLFFACVANLVLVRFGTKTDAARQLESLQRKFLYGSLLIVLLCLNAICFIALFSSDIIVHWTDIRYWPWWAMIVPISLAVFSVSGLLLTRKRIATAMLLLVGLCCFQGDLSAAESRMKLLEPAKFVSDTDAREAAKNTSRPGQGGYYADPKIIDCFAAMEYHYSGGRYNNKPVRFRLRSPQNIEPDKKYPLIVWFHGRGESGDDNARQLAHLQIAMEFFAGPNHRDFFVLATQCPKDNNQWTRSLDPEGKGDAPMTIAGEIMETLIREYPIDENRLSACGFSSGGTGAWEFGRKSPRRLAALGACSGNPVKDAKPEEYLGPAIWAFNNKGDGGVSHTDASVFIEAINTGGGNAYLSLYDQGGHDSWTKAMKEEKIIGWLILQSLEKPGPPQGIVCRPLSKTSQFAMFGLPLLVIAACLVPQFMKRKRRMS